MLIDKEGHMVTKTGSTDDFDMQAVSALALIGAAFITRGSTLRTAYPKNS